VILLSTNSNEDSSNDVEDW